jgi:hypothetical protein
MERYFAPRSSDGGRVELIIGGKSYASLSELDSRHHHTLFTLLTFVNPNKERCLLPFSFGEFCDRCGLETNSPAAGEALKFLQDLLSGSMRITDPKSGESMQMPIFDCAVIIGSDNA